MFHVNPQTGDVGRCRATRGGCPFGGPSKHFLTAETARFAYETWMKDAEADAEFNRSESSIDYTPEQALEKFNKEIKGRPFRLDKEHVASAGYLLEELYGKDPSDASPGADLGHTELKALLEGGAKDHITLCSVPAGKNLMTIREKYSPTTSLKMNLAGENWIKRGPYKYRLMFDDKKREISLLVADENGTLLERKGALTWDYSFFEGRVENKLANIAVVRYKREFEKSSSTEDEGDYKVVFTNMHLTGYTKKSIIEKLKSGDVRMEMEITARKRRMILATNLKKLFPES